MFEGKSTTAVLDPEVEVGAGGVGASVVEAIARADRAHLQACRASLELLRAIDEVDRAGAWDGPEVYSCAHWVQMRYGVSAWKAQRWVGAARTLEDLPRVGRALDEGELSLDKVVELTRFATPATEEGLVTWARRVSSGAIRARGDVEVRRERGEAARVEQERSVRWWYEDDGRRFGLEALLPAASGAVVANALEREAVKLPVLPTDEDHPNLQEARRADALVAICSAKVATDPDADRATVVLHVPLAALGDDPDQAPAAEGPADAVIPAATLQRLVCSGRVTVAVEDLKGDALYLGRASRTPTAQQVRLVRRRDRGCVFPGCGSRRFTQVHHVRWWRHGGKTDLDELALVCSWHHRLVHEHDWHMRRGPNGVVRWFRPDGERYRAGPAPPLGRGTLLTTRLSGRAIHNNSSRQLL